jgi:hypothetical protein
MAPRKQTQSIYQLKITLKGSRPPIWRRVQVRSDVTLGHLHWVIQHAMGWMSCHLHAFTINGVDYGAPMADMGFDEMAVRDQESVKLSKVIPGETFKFSYTYDFGDSWDHDILVEKVLAAEPDVSYPVCIKAKRACPPEDCGGIWGYRDFLDAIQSADHPEHGEMLEWVGGYFDPEEVDLAEINQLLKTIPSNTANFEG